MQLKTKGRNRSDSEDGFTLPDLPCDDENRDL